VTGCPSLVSTESFELAWKCQYVLDRTIRTRCPRWSVNTPPLSFSVAVISVPVVLGACVEVAVGVPADGAVDGEAAGPVPELAHPVSTPESSSAARPVK
jgi:hypothetical protein